jgi:CheY-like chemotaxis protein
MITGELFFHYLRSALNHLYDPYFLHKSALVKVFNLGDQPDTPAALQRILNDAIAALEPKPGDPNPAQRKRQYELIMYRYVQQFDQEEVSNQLGVSVRHLRREQNAAIHELAAQLWESYRLGAKPFHISDLETVDGSVGTIDIALEDIASTGAVGLPQLGPGPDPSSLDWIDHSPLDEPVNLDEVLTAVVELSEPLARRYEVKLVIHPQAEKAGLAIHEVSLRQILLNILSVAVRRPGGGEVQITRSLIGSQVEIRLVRTETADEPGRLDENMVASLAIATQMTQRYKGTLIVKGVSGESFEASILLPIFQRKTLLVIDDNDDFIQLVERTLTGMRYTVLHQSDPLRAVEYAQETHPDMIMLDVMMPRVDGWEILGRLRRHPATANIPIMICTILPQEELALSLGAAAFIRKPVTAEVILASLERLSPEPADR